MKRKDIYFIRQLDAQKEKKKAIFGCAVLLSREAIAEKAAAEKAESEKYVFKLSEREKEIVKNLG